MEVDREKFVQCLDSCSPGLTPSDTTEQSSCFGFHDGMIYTYNTEILCRIPSPAPIEGAVDAKELLELLKEIPADVIDIRPEDGYLGINCKKPMLKSGVTMQAEMLMPVFGDNIETPADDWRPLAEGFSEAVRLVYACCSKDQNKVALSKVHIHPQYVEAADNYHGARYRIETPIDEPCLTTRLSCSHIGQLGFTEISVTDNWLHFRNDTDLIFSCRRLDSDDYPEIGSFFSDKETIPAAFPKTLLQTIKRAAIFSRSRTDDDIITLSLKPGLLVIEGRSDRGFVREQKKISYYGQDMTFRVSPKLLANVLSEYQDYCLGQFKLLVKRKNFRYMTTLLAGE